MGLLAHLTNIRLFTSLKKHKWPQTKMCTNSGIVSHTLSHGMNHFGPGLKTKNHKDTSIWLASEEVWAIREVVSGAWDPLQTKCITLIERVWKTICPKMVSEIVCIFVCGHLFVQNTLKSWQKLQSCGCQGSRLTFSKLALRVLL